MYFAVQFLALLVLLLPFMSQDNEYPTTAKDSVKWAFLISLMTFALFVNSGKYNYSYPIFINLTLLEFSMTLYMGKYAIFFTPIALFVTWSILEFSLWYMKTDPNINLFFKMLITFLLSMLLLIYAENLLLLFIGWEGVGLMSFMLIGWYYSRSDVASAALQAAIYNRLGDIGFMLALCWLITRMQSSSLPYYTSNSLPTAILLGFILAAASKSAQFGMHPWLASAMEGPTPVSALLHSSTMVVAGIFLLIQVFPSISNNNTALTTCLFLGALTTMIAATLAFIQNDIKKIVAYSTSSQLGLMMVSIGLGQPDLAFFHICTHAFFKAMLFLSSGFIIHTSGGNQDIRKLGGLKAPSPIMTTCIIIGSFALMGLPFLTGFYSKDAIIEAATTSYVNCIALSMTLMAVSFTAIYSMRIIYYATMHYPRSSTTITANEPSKVRNPLIRLALGSIIAGSFLYYLLPPAPMILTMPTYMKLTAFTVTLISFAFAYFMIMLYWTLPMLPTPSPKNKDPFDHTDLFHRPATRLTLNSAWSLVGHLIESIICKKITGPGQIPNSIKSASKKVKSSQTGLIKIYTLIFFTTYVFTMIAAVVTQSYI